MLSPETAKEIRSRCFNFIASNPFFAHRSPVESTQFRAALIEQFPDDVPALDTIINQTRMRFRRMTVNYGELLIAHPLAFKEGVEDLTQRGQELLAHHFRKLIASRIAEMQTVAYGDVWEFAVSIPAFYEVWHSAYRRVNRELE